MELCGPLLDGCVLCHRLCVFESYSWCVYATAGNMCLAMCAISTQLASATVMRRCAHNRKNCECMHQVDVDGMHMVA